VAISDVKKELFSLRETRRSFAFAWRWICHKALKGKMDRTRARGESRLPIRMEVLANIFRR